MHIESTPSFMWQLPTNSNHQPNKKFIKCLKHIKHNTRIAFNFRLINEKRIGKSTQMLGFMHTNTSIRVSIKWMINSMYECLHCVLRVSFASILSNGGKILCQHLLYVCRCVCEIRLLALASFHFSIATLNFNILHNLCRTFFYALFCIEVF